MENRYKLALAFLYLLQLLIVFKESVTEAYKHAAEVIHGKAVMASVDDAAGDGWHPLSVGREPFALHHGAAAHAAFVLGHEIHMDEHHVLHHHSKQQPETEDEVKRMRRRRWREILLANLFPSFRRFSEPAQTADTPAFIRLRPTSFLAA